MYKYSVQGLWRTALVCLVCAIILTALIRKQEKLIAEQIVFLDVGQGDATLVADSGGSVLLTDAGPDAQIAQTIEQVIPFGRGYIDAIVVTHPQQDHFYGISALIDHYDVGVFMYSGQEAQENNAWKALLEKLKKKKIPIVTLKKGDRIRHDSFLSVDILHPTQDVLGSAELNDTSIVQRVLIGGFSLLITGDIDTRIEKQLLLRGLSQVDFLKVAHHGSAFSSSQDFLNVVHPKVAVIEYGLHNTYGHPSASVEERIKKMGISLFETAKDGTVKILLSYPNYHIFSIR